MALLRFDSVNLAYGAKPLLLGVSFGLEARERVCLVGRNGEGKSSFLGVAIGKIIPDDGERWIEPGVRIGELQQEVPRDDDGDVYDIVAGGLSEAGDLLKEYHHLVQSEMNESDLKRLEIVQHNLEAVDGWQLNIKVENIIKRLELDAEAKMSSLSGGWKRRVLLARALVSSPDILILDEPTNHLDIPAIQWLEDQLMAFNGAVIFVSHDRSFIKKMGTRIIELDRGLLTSWPGDYGRYLEGKRKMLEEEERHNALFDKRLSEEEVWIRKGIKARRTRNEGRVRSLLKLRDERRARIDKQGNVSIKLESSEISGKLVVEAKGVSWSYSGPTGVPIINNFSTTILRGDRIGFIGENGCGKTTLLKLLLGELSPQSGSINIGTNLKVAYFDQLRTALDPEKSVANNVSDGGDFIELAGKRQHIIGYLNDFLFTSERARTPVKALSGGERNRLLLAKLFSKPSNILVLDEPTNDLDIETLELLEEALTNYDGTILLISHDREFIDSICTSAFAFEDDGVIKEYVGGYSDWRRQGPGFPSERKGFAKSDEGNYASEPAKKNQSVGKNTESQGKLAGRSKLSYKLKSELDALPGKINQLEEQQKILKAQTESSEFYNQPHEQVNAILAEVSELALVIEEHLERWMELEEMAEG